MNHLNKISLTSDRQYLKIWKSDLVTISANGTPDSDSSYPADPSSPFGFSGSLVVPHTLGYVPFVRAFWDPDKDGSFYGEKSSNKDPWLKVIAKNSYVKLIMNTDGAAKLNIPVYYRIYDIGNVSVSSDLLIDKIFLKNTTSGIVGSSVSSLDLTESVIVIPNPSGERPLYSVQFSQDNNNWYAAGTKIIGPFDTSSGPPGGPYSRYYYTSVYAKVNKDNLYIFLQNNYPVSKQIYVRYELDYVL